MDVRSSKALDLVQLSQWQTAMIVASTKRPALLYSLPCSAEQRGENVAKDRLPPTVLGFSLENGLRNPNLRSQIRNTGFRLPILLEHAASTTAARPVPKTHLLSKISCP
jgi:hypothetical protein